MYRLLRKVLKYSFWKETVVSWVEDACVTLHSARPPAPCFANYVALSICWVAAWSSHPHAKGHLVCLDNTWGAGTSQYLTWGREWEKRAGWPDDVAIMCTVTNRVLAIVNADKLHHTYHIPMTLIGSMWLVLNMHEDGGNPHATSCVWIQPKVITKVSLHIHHVMINNNESQQWQQKTIHNHLTFMPNFMHIYKKNLTPVFWLYTCMTCTPTPVELQQRRVPH